MKYCLAISLFGLLLMGCSQEDSISFSDQIKPILDKNCLKCHGGIKKLGDYSLLFPEEALLAGKSGVAGIVPNHPGRSELVRRIKHQDPDVQMPQEDDPLSKEEIRLIEKWIDEGAVFDDHWAYRELRMPDIPDIDSDWVANEIDQFVLDKMSDHDLTPNPRARPDKLVRRLSLDLTGLPPKYEAVGPLIESGSDVQINAWVDTLLHSPHFGEHFAAMWLDLARYADSNGYEKDMGRSVWRFRDWVIEALNRDMPFDQFSIEQLAGDLLPDPTTDQLIATAFHRNTMTNTEGGTEDEEFRVMALVDRVNTTFEVWQGTTMSCVQCHDHPYDPIEIADYYKAFATFNNTQDADLDSNYPVVIETPDSTASKMREIAAKIHDLDSNYPATLKGEITTEKIKDYVFPRLFGSFADDYQHVLISDNWFSNSAYNANNQKNKKYYLIYNEISFDQLSDLKLHFRSNGSDVRVDLYIDELNSDPIAQSMLVSPEDHDWSWHEISLPRISGEHDLIFHFVNTTGSFRTGVATFREIELVYDNRPVLSKTLRAHQDSLLTLYWSGIKTPVQKERSDLLPRDNHVLERGNYLVKGMEVKPGIPRIFAKRGPHVNDRLDFAKWLVSNKNGLTARVMVNRIWSYIFGIGLVSTPEDFGSQGEVPTHPDLMEYLAFRFAHDWEWSIKTLVKEIVSSATYQQSSKSNAQKQEVDPYNLWLSRSNRVRLSAEQIRDQALAVSDLLVRKIGGPSVMPPQPDGVWQVVYSSARWKPTKDEEKYRRGLYTYWKRTTPYPSMIAFDSPSREFCVSKRIRTNTPLQALVTLNDTVFIEAAQELGTWMQNEGHGDLTSTIKKGYQKALLSYPDKEELSILIDLYHEASQPKIKLVSEKEEIEQVGLEPLTVVANAILNLDAFLTKS